MAKAIALENLPEVRLLEDITRESAARLIEELSIFKGRQVALSIFSDGGDAHGAFAVAEYIGNPANDMRVEARVYGNAASGAMIIAAAAQKAYIAPGAFALVHNAFVAGAEPDKDQQAVLDAMNERQRELFSKRTGKTKASIEKLMEADKPITADDAVAMGFFDGIIPQAARIAAFKQIPMEDKKTFTVKVDRAILAKAIVTGEVELTTEQVQATEAEKVKSLDEQIAALTKERDEMKAKAEEADKAKAEADAAKAEAVKAKEAADVELVAAKDETAKYVAAIDKLKKEPLVAQTLPDGTQVVIPGGGKEAPKMSKAEERIVKTQSVYSDFLKQYDENNKKA